MPATAHARPPFRPAAWMIVLALGLDVLLAVVGCRRREPPPPPPAVGAAVASSAPTPARPEPPKIVSSALSDRELGRIIDALSEASGEFPSDNFVSNETSYLHVADDLRALPRGGAYVGVGPEQNLTYLALLEPELAFVVDIRRQNLVQHLLYKALFERTTGRAGFVAALVGREAPKEPLPEATIDEVIGAALAAPRSTRDEARAFTQELVSSLGIRFGAGDAKHLDKILAAFREKGLDLRYTMKGSSRSYPTLGELLRMGDAKGAPASFLGTDAAFRKVQRMMSENRVVPLVGDFAGSTALAGVAKELRERSLPLRVFYVSNVEQYIFDPKPWKAWSRNLHAMPWAEDGTIVRVYFDQGRKHPLQRDGHRTVSMTKPARAFLERLDGKGFRSFWEVATE